MTDHKKNLPALIQERAEKYATALPAHIRADQFTQMAIRAATSNPDIAACKPATILNALMRCAEDGLLPDGRNAALVKFGDSCQYMPMVAGLMRLARQSGEVLSIDAQVVFDKDEFAYTLGDSPSLHHEPFIGADRGKPIYTYAIARLKNGEVLREVLSEAEIQAIRAASRSKSGPWAGAFQNEMRRKSAIRRLVKRLPLSTDIADQRFERAVTEMDASIDFDAAQNAQEKAPIKKAKGFAAFDEPEPVVDAEYEQAPVDAAPPADDHDAAWSN